jgi:hypothetical protein
MQAAAGDLVCCFQTVVKQLCSQHHKHLATACSKHTVKSNTDPALSGQGGVYGLRNDERSRMMSRLSEYDNKMQPAADSLQAGLPQTLAADTTLSKITYLVHKLHSQLPQANDDLLKAEHAEDITLHALRQQDPNEGAT